MMKDRLIDYEHDHGYDDPPRAETTADGDDDVITLNSEQRKAMEADADVVRIFAGPGTGKTAVMTRRAVDLMMNRGVYPRDILAVTFTNKATDEMDERIYELRPERHLPEVRTTHSFGYKFLQIHPAASRTKEASVYDVSDQRSVITSILEQLAEEEEEEKNPEFGQIPIKRVRNLIGDRKNRLLNPTDIDSPREPWERRVYTEYEAALVENNAYDFDDLLKLPVEAMAADKELAGRWGRRYEHVLVDEFQDINLAQFKLIEFLVGDDYLTVVGDDDQCIYEWRLAKPKYIREVGRHFGHLGEVKDVMLAINYRCPPAVMEHASQLIAKNNDRVPKEIETAKETGAHPELQQCHGAKDEARYVAGRIGGLVDTGEYDYDDCCVLYRQNSQSQPFESAFNDAGIPYEIVGGLSFWERMEVKDIVAYVRLALNPDDDVALERIINQPRRGIGQATEETLEELAERHSISKFGALDHLADIDDTRARRCLADFADVMKSICEQVPESPSAAVQAVIDATDYVEHVVEVGDQETRNRRGGNIQRLISLAQEAHMDGLETAEFVRRASLLAMDDVQDGESDRVSLMTVHRAKGTESPIVFLVGMNGSYMPASWSNNIEEERRLCYVGMTRAKERLICTTHPERRRAGWAQPSQFIREAGLD